MAFGFILKIKKRSSGLKALSIVSSELEKMRKQNIEKLSAEELARISSLMRRAFSRYVQKDLSCVGAKDLISLLGNDAKLSSTTNLLLTIDTHRFSKTSSSINRNAALDECLKGIQEIKNLLNKENSDATAN